MTAPAPPVSGPCGDAKELDELASRIRQCGRAQGRQGGGPLMVQEGVLTHERINDAVAEPVVYMMDRYVVGGYYPRACRAR